MFSLKVTVSPFTKQAMYVSEDAAPDGLAHIIVPKDTPQDTIDEIESYLRQENLKEQKHRELMKIIKSSTYGKE